MASKQPPRQAVNNKEDGPRSMAGYMSCKSSRFPTTGYKQKGNGDIDQFTVPRGIPSLPPPSNNYSAARRSVSSSFFGNVQCREAILLFPLFPSSFLLRTSVSRATSRAGSRAHSIGWPNKASCSKRHVHPHEMVLVSLEAFHARRHAHDCVWVHCVLIHELYARSATTRRRVHARDVLNVW